MKAPSVPDVQLNLGPEWNLPFMFSAGSAFPVRDLVAGVIILSLIVVTTLLSGLLRHLHFPPEQGEEAAEDSASVSAGEAALVAIARPQGGLTGHPAEVPDGLSWANRPSVR